MYIICRLMWHIWPRCRSRQLQCNFVDLLCGGYPGWIVKRWLGSPPHPPIPHLQPVYWGSCHAIPGAGQVLPANSTDRSYDWYEDPGVMVPPHPTRNRYRPLSLAIPGHVIACFARNFSAKGWKPCTNKYKSSALF